MSNRLKKPHRRKQRRYVADLNEALARGIIVQSTCECARLGFLHVVNGRPQHNPGCPHRPPR
jgi:hypothetical protein